MDNFRRSKRSTNIGNVDGLIRRRMKPITSRQAKETVYKPGSGTKSAPEQRIGNFARNEGFIPRKIVKPAPSVPDGRSLGRKPRYNKPPIDMTIDDKPKKRTDKKKKPRNWKRLAKRTAISLCAVVVLLGGYLGVKAFLAQRNIFKGGGSALALDGDIDPSLLKGEGDGRVNILILGKGGPEQTDGPDLTDTIIVASIDPINKEAGLLSVPRDLAVKADSGETMKINAIYAMAKMSAKAKNKSDDEAENAGISAIEKSIENVVGLKMHFYTMLDFTAFEQAVNAVGGVDVNVKDGVYERMRLKGKPYTLDVKPGNQHFDGLRALAYTRCRHCDNRSDFGRSERQRQIIVALRGKVLSAGTLSNPAKISQLIDAFGSRVRTNLSIDDISKLVNLGQAIDDSKIASVSLVDEPNVLIKSGNYPALASLGSIQVPAEGLYKYDAIRSFVRNTFKDGFIKKENAGVVVLNGTNTAGLAKTKADVLKGYGYNVIHVGDGPDKNTPNTILVNLRGDEKKYTNRYLELRYKTTSTGSLPAGIEAPEGADFVIILGQNETSNR